MPEKGSSPDNGAVLVVDDEVPVGRLIGRFLGEAGIETEHAASVEEGLEQIERRLPGMVLVDLNMPERDGFEFLELARKQRPELPVVVMTAQGSVEAAVTAMKRGAFDFLSKPFESSEVVVAACRRALAHHDLLKQNRDLKERLSNESGQTIVGSTPVMTVLRRMISAVAPTDATVLIIGETGTGKELVARDLHAQSNRSQGPFLAINCGALSESLLESELFGHVRGAFTGATTSRRGIFEAASGGTLFLDEVGELTLSTQTRLLRVLQEGEIRPVGSETNRPVDVRVIAATHRDLEQEVSQGRFREDLYYRLNVFHLRIPPLRERLADIPLLTAHFLNKLSRKQGRTPPSIEPAALEWLMKQSWRGNLRQLENSIERALILAADEVTVELFETIENWMPPSSGVVTPRAEVTDPAEPVEPLRLARHAFERRYLERLLAAVDGSRADAARLAHLDPSNLRRLLKRHHLE